MLAFRSMRLSKILYVPSSVFMSSVHSTTMFVLLYNSGYIQETLLSIAVIVFG